jgi:hypothetical protein
MSYKQILIQMGCICSLVITTTTAPYLGIQSVGTASFAILILYFLYDLITRNYVYTSSQLKNEISLLIVFILYSSFKILDHDYLSIQSAFFFIAVPILIAILVQNQTHRIKISLTRILVLFFIIQCVLAIYEKIFGVNIFPYKVEIDNIYIRRESWEFRSTSLLGHPLNNALCTSIILGFILASKYTAYFKFFALFLGFIAMLCFNARGAVLIWVLLGLYFLYQLYSVQNKKSITKIIIPTLSIILCIFIFYLISETSLGGRLFNKEKIIDGSAQTRLDVWAAFKYMKGYDLWLGNPKNYLPITNKLGAAGVENSLVVIILNYGIIFGTGILIYTSMITTKYLNNYNKNQIIYILTSFILIGSLNNSLAGITPWVIFYFCVHSFHLVGSRIKDKRINVQN